MFNLVKKYAIFIFGGGLGALLNLSVTYLLVEFLGMWYIFAYCIGGALSIIFNFTFQRIVTFKIMDDMMKRLGRFIMVSIAISLCMLMSVYILTDILKIWYILSGIISIAFLSIINFSLNMLWIFEKRKK